MRYFYLYFLATCIAELVACSKSDNQTQANNINTPVVTPVTIKIDTTITYTPFYYPFEGSQKSFDFPILDGVNNPVIKVYYKLNNQASWKTLPDGNTAWFIRQQKRITVFVWARSSEITVNIVAAW